MTSSDPSGPSPYRSSILLSYLCTMLFWGAVYIYMPILAPYAQMVSGSLQSVGLVMGAYGLSQLILRIPLGIWSDRWRRRKPFILLGFIFDGLAALGLLLSTGTVMLFFSVLTAGIAASMWVPFTVLFASYFPAGKVVYSMSLILFFTRLSQIISNYAGAAMAEVWGWGAPFFAGTVLSLVGLLMAAGLAEHRPGQSSAVSFKKLSLACRNRTLLLSSMICTLFQFANFSINYGFAPIFAQAIGASKTDLGILFLCHMVPNSLTTLLSGTYIRNRFSERSIIFAGFFLVAGAILFIPFINRLGTLYMIQAINGIGSGLVFALLMGLSIQSIPREQQATAMGFFQSLYAAGMSLGPILSGFIAQQWGLSSVFILNGLLCLFGAFFSFMKIPSAARSDS
jgi:predicted MFS family arabinose efflux permease